MNDLSMNNPKAKFTVWLIVFILIGGAFYWYLIRPQFLQIKDLEKQISVKEEKLATLQLAREREKSLLDENKQLEDRIAVLQKILPSERNEFLFGEEFQTVAKLCGVKIENLNFSTRGVKGAPSNSVPFTLTISADKLEKINWFFVHTSIFPQIISLTNINISKGSASQGGFSPMQSKGTRYTVNMNGVIYLSGRK